MRPTTVSYKLDDEEATAVVDAVAAETGLQFGPGVATLQLSIDRNGQANGLRVDYHPED